MSDASPYDPPRARVVDQAVSDASKIALTDQEVRALVGAKANYYLNAWNETDERGAPQLTLNWAALLLAPVWFPYRKMYKAAVIFYAVVVTLGLLEDLLFVGILGLPKTPRELATPQALLTSIVCGALGNEWYRSHARRLVAKLRALRLPEDAYFAALSRRGGTSILDCVGTTLLLLGAAIVAVTLSRSFLGFYS